MFVLMADEAQIPASNGAGISSRNAHPVLTFDDTTDESAIWSGAMSEDYDGSAAVDVIVVSTAATATSGSVGWEVSIERVANAGTDVDADSFDTAQTVSAAVSGTSGIATYATVAFADQTEMDGLQAGEYFRLKLTRDASVASDHTGDAEVYAVIGVLG
jgi:hypothetical protein